MLVAPSTAQDPEMRLVRASLEALEARAGAGGGDDQSAWVRRPLPLAPANAVVVDWLSYSQLMPQAPRWWSATGGTGRWRGRSVPGRPCCAART